MLQSCTVVTSTFILPPHPTIQFSNVKYSRLNRYDLEIGQDRLLPNNPYLPIHAHLPNSFHSWKPLQLKQRCRIRQYIRTAVPTDKASSFSTILNCEEPKGPSILMRTIMAYGQETSPRLLFLGPRSAVTAPAVTTLLCRDDPSLTLHNYTWRPSNLINHGVSKLKSYICPSPRPLTWAMWHVISKWSITSTVLYNKTEWWMDFLTISSVYTSTAEQKCTDVGLLRFWGHIFLKCFDCNSAHLSLFIHFS
jgi:hypothetical protein